MKRGFSPAPVFGVGVGVAVPGAVAKGVSISVGVPQMAGYILLTGIADRFQRIKEAQNAVALFGARQVQRGLGQGVQALG